MRVIISYDVNEAVWGAQAYLDEMAAQGIPEDQRAALLVELFKEDMGCVVEYGTISVELGDSDGWITHRDPTIEELRITFKRGDYIAYGGRFIVACGDFVTISEYNKPPKGNGGWYTGYWNREDVDMWMPLPAARKSSEDEH